MPNCFLDVRVMLESVTALAKGLYFISGGILNEMVFFSVSLQYATIFSSSEFVQGSIYLFLSLSTNAHVTVFHFWRVRVLEKLQALSLKLSAVSLRSLLFNYTANQ